MSDREPDTDLARFERLEALVRTLVERHRVLAAEHAKLREGIKERDGRIKALDSKLVGLNQTRRDAAKRIDDLIAQIEHVEAELERRLEGTVPRE